MIVYLVTNTVNGKKYVGITSKSLPHRWSQHCYLADRATEKSYAIHRAIAKYGRDAFTREVLATAQSMSDLNTLEIAAIAEHQSFGPNGYNMTAGGGGITGFFHSPETRAKIQAAHADKRLSPEHIAAIIKANTGRPMSEAHKQVLRDRVISDEDRLARSARAKGNQWAKGVIRSPEFCAAISERQIGRLLTVETKEKIRAARALQAPTFGMKGKTHSEDTRKKMSDAKKGKKKSPETIERMRIAARKRMADRKNG